MKELNLSMGLSTVVDDEVFEWASQHKWHTLKCAHTNYAVRNVFKNGKRTLSLLHREILKPEDGQYVDHIDMNGLNNLLSNIRICTRRENNRHQGRRRDNSSGHKGVNFNKSANKWVARIQIGDIRIFLGYFDSAEDAAEKYNIAAEEFFGEFAVLNNTKNNASNATPAT